MDNLDSSTLLIGNNYNSKKGCLCTDCFFCRSLLQPAPGVELLPKGRKKDALRVWLEQLRQRFAGRILSFDAATALRWGGLTARSQLQGRNLPVIDSMLAATALQHSAVLATRTTADFEAAGVETVNPWIQ